MLDVRRGVVEWQAAFACVCEDGGGEEECNDCDEHLVLCERVHFQGVWFALVKERVSAKVSYRGHVVEHRE